jgi:hypothetical protein
MAILSRRVRSDDWTPVGVDALEANALKVVRSVDNSSVVAGPGAGKTELLAQRAAYLLQTGAAPSPQRVLAISFKRDAATNLAARVRQRCHRNHAGRFDSITFDAFAKGLLDRFGQALPDRWRPRPDYEIMFSGDRYYRDFLYQQAGVPPKSVGTYGDIQAITVKVFERTYLFGPPLPIDGWPNPTPGQWAADRFWQTSLHSGKKSYLSFPMIGRLAELLLRVNPIARDALRLTYSHLFMDDDTAQAKIARELDAYATQLGTDHPEPPKSKADARSLVNDVLDFIGRERLIAVHPAYGQGDWFAKVVDAAMVHLLASSADAADWTTALDFYEGTHAVPLMTIHKSKGLEYHSVIFVGLDDGAWWSFAGDQIEATAGFFVAFTRAKQRVVFTYSARRGARTKIATLYGLLSKAGVQIVQIA